MFDNRQLVTRPPDPHHPALHPSAPRRSKSRRPARKRRRTKVEGGPERSDSDREGVDGSVRESLDQGGEAT